LKKSNRGEETGITISDIAKQKNLPFRMEIKMRNFTFKVLKTLFSVITSVA